MLRVGDIIITNYGTGPYRVIQITWDCRCPDYLTQINCDGTPCGHQRDCSKCPLTKDQDPHMHLVCVDANEPIRDQYPHYKLYFLNGYKEYPDGSIRCVWNPADRVVVVRHQGELSFLDWAAQEAEDKEA